MPAETVIVAPPSEPTAVAVGTVGARISHCARSVVLAAGIVKSESGVKTLDPSLQPSNAKNVRAKVVGRARSTSVPATAVVIGGSTPVVAPSTL